MVIKRKKSLGEERGRSKFLQEGRGQFNVFFEASCWASNFIMFRIIFTFLRQRKCHE